MVVSARSITARLPLRTVPGLVLCALAGLGGCAAKPQDATLPGRHHCEAFFVYRVCVADRDEDGVVDYMYFDDDGRIFMYDSATREALMTVQPFHKCAIPMSESNRSLSSQLLYGDDLALSTRLSLKGRLLRNYRAAQPAVDACNAPALSQPPPTGDFEDPFLVDEGWDNELVDDNRDGAQPQREDLGGDQR